MNTKKKAICILLIVVLLLLIGGAIALVQSKKGTSVKPNNSKEDTVEKTMVIENGETTESHETEDFTDKTTAQSDKTDGKVLGGSETLEIIRPSEENKDDTDDKGEKEEKIEWLPGIW